MDRSMTKREWRGRYRALRKVENPRGNPGQYPAHELARRRQWDLQEARARLPRPLPGRLDALLAKQADRREKYRSIRDGGYQTPWDREQQRRKARQWLRARLELDRGLDS